MRNRTLIVSTVLVSTYIYIFDKNFTFYEKDSKLAQRHSYTECALSTHTKRTKSEYKTTVVSKLFPIGDYAFQNVFILVDSETVLASRWLYRCIVSTKMRQRRKTANGFYSEHWRGWSGNSVMGVVGVWLEDLFNGSIFPHAWEASEK